jgi:hypothetical protein
MQFDYYLGNLHDLFSRDSAFDFKLAHYRIVASVGSRLECIAVLSTLVMHFDALFEQ